MENEIVKYLMMMASLMQGGDRITQDAAKFLFDRLKTYPEKSVIKALNRCLAELKFFPSFSEIVDRIDDGRPDVEEAWALLPHDERSSVVWTDEMRKAFAVANPLLIEGDMISARMAFKESYQKEVANARSNGAPVVWSPSFGYDKTMRVNAIVTALEKNRIQIKHAVAMLPEILDLAPNNKQVLEYKKKLNLEFFDEEHEQSENATKVMKQITTSFKGF
jgi:hypothetical protein